MATTLRSSGLVRQELDAIASELGEETDRRYVARLRGADAGLQWMIGRSSVAPVSGRLMERPQSPDAYSEAMWADEVTTGVRPAPPGMSTEYAGGVAAGLLWALGRSGQAPSPLGNDAPLRALSAIEREYEGNLALLQNPPPKWLAEDVDEERGVVAGLAWLLGIAPSSISGRPASASRAEVEAEMEAAQALTAMGAPQGPVSREFAGGILRRFGLGAGADQPSARPGLLDERGGSLSPQTSDTSRSVSDV